MTSTRERQQRAAARARLARQMAERQAAARKRRQWQLAIGGAVALVLVVAGTFWIVGAVTDDDPSSAAAPTPTPTSAGEPAAPGPCAWNEVPADDTAVDVGLPPEGEPRTGTQTVTVTTNHGEIAVQLDLAAAPCTAASFSHLASQAFYDGTYCHRMFPGMLQCGDPNAKDAGYKEQEGIGAGGPSYRYANENLPTDASGVAAGSPYYPAGTVAMANSGLDTNGSQFFFIFEDMDLDGPNYSVVGQVIEGMDVLQQIGEAGHDGALDETGGSGHPNEDVIIESLTVSSPAA